MNETIGVKGGRQDLIRTMRISKKQKEKLTLIEEEKSVRELEKKVRRQQTFTLIRTLPIVISFGTIQTLYDVATNKHEHDLEEEKSKWNIREYDGDISSKTPFEERRQKNTRIITTPSGEKVVVHMAPLSFDFDKAKPMSLVPKKIEEVVEILPLSTPKVSKGIPDSDFHDSDQKEEKSFFDVPFFEGEHVDSLEEKLQEIESYRIVLEYEKQLKDIRFELRQLVYDYAVLEEDERQIVFLEDAEIILERLSQVISKLEELKKKIQVDSWDQMDDNYIYTLIEDYLKEFKNGNFVSKFKDSPLYVEISKKLDEIDGKKDSFSKRLDDRRDKLALKEDDFSKLKAQSTLFEKVNQQLRNFQEDQERFLAEIQEKIANSMTVHEKTEIQFQAMNRQGRRLMRMLSLQMMFPGLFVGRAVATTAASYLYFMQQIVHPTTVTRKFKVVEVKDYQDTIENSIHALDDAHDLLGKTVSQIDKMMLQLKEEYQQYAGIFSEYDEIFRNLKRVKRDLEEKEYEMEKMRDQQMLVLSQNNAKVLKRGTYPMSTDV